MGATTRAAAAAAAALSSSSSSSSPSKASTDHDTTTTKTTAATTMTSTTKNNARFNAEAAAWDSNPFIQAMSAEAWRAIQNNVTCFRDSSETGRPPANAKPNVLEIGCGTGTLSLLVAPHAQQLVAVDAAEGMVEVLKGKLADNAQDFHEKKKKSREPKMDFSNVVPICVMLEDPEDPNLPPRSSSSSSSNSTTKATVTVVMSVFDLVISHLVLHHIPDMAPVLRTMLGCLKPDGVVALTDFEDFGPEARRFHPEGKMEGVERHGINKEAMRQLMCEVGFAEVRVEVAWRTQKKVEKFPGEFGDTADGAEGQGEEMEFPFLICTGKRP
ncbi:S-adenosyl-L-methionine-dependent methyltransferase [Apiospora arundinis]